MTDENFYAGEFHPYDNPARPHPLGENVLSFRDGKTIIEKKPPEETSSIWKGAKRILSLSDDAIHEYPARPNGDVWYRIENGSVRWRKGDNYFCGTPGHGRDCPQIRRIARFRKEHAPDALVERWREGQETK